MLAAYLTGIKREYRDSTTLTEMLGEKKGKVRKRLSVLTCCSKWGASRQQEPPPHPAEKENPRTSLRSTPSGGPLDKNTRHHTKGHGQTGRREKGEGRQGQKGQKEFRPLLTFLVSLI